MQSEEYLFFALGQKPVQGKEGPAKRRFSLWQRPDPPGRLDVSCPIGHKRDGRFSGEKQKPCS